MSLYTVHLLTQDEDFRARCVAAAAVEGVSDDPWSWTMQRISTLAAAPGFGDKYWYALQNGVESPGRDESVISDQDILAAVQAMQPFAVIAPPLSEEPGPA